MTYKIREKLFVCRKKITQKTGFDNFCSHKIRFSQQNAYLRNQNIIISI